MNSIIYILSTKVRSIDVHSHVNFSNHVVHRHDVKYTSVYRQCMCNKYCQLIKIFLNRSLSFWVRWRKQSGQRGMKWACPSCFVALLGALVSLSWCLPYQKTKHDNILQSSMPNCYEMCLPRYCMLSFKPYMCIIPYRFISKQ